MISLDLLFSFYLDLYSVICGLFDDRNVSRIQSRLLRCADLRRVHFAKKRIFSSLWAWFATVSSSQFSHMGWRSSFANDDVQHCSKSFQNFLVEAAFVLAHVPVHVSQGRARAQDAENCRFSLGIIVKTLLLHKIYDPLTCCTNIVWVVNVKTWNSINNKLASAWLSVELLRTRFSQFCLNVLSKGHNRLLDLICTEQT